MPAIPVHHTQTSDASWDGSANEVRVRSPESPSYFARIYAWRDPDAEGDRKAHYKFIHHYVSADGTPGPASIIGCRTGIAVLNGARGGTTIPEADYEGVWRHLAAHMRDAGIEPPELRAPGETETEDFGVVIRELRAEVTEVSERTHRFVITTGDVDRDGDRINPAGWRLSNYMRNPVVLWAHDLRTPPIGRALEISEEDGALTALIEWAPRDVHPLAGTVADLYRLGFLHAVSVGFVPIRWAPRRDGRGIEYEEQELVEISAVPVPANARALIQRGVDIDYLLDWAKTFVKSASGERIYTVRDVERMLRDAGVSRRRALELTSASRWDAETELLREVISQLKSLTEEVRKWR